MATSDQSGPTLDIDVATDHHVAHLDGAPVDDVSSFFSNTYLVKVNGETVLVASHELQGGEFGGE